MEPAELTACSSHSTPPTAVQMAVSTIERYLREGASPQEVAQAIAAVQHPQQPRQGRLPL